MARVDTSDVVVGVGVGVFNRFGPELVAKIPAIGTYGAKIIQFGPAVAGLGMTLLDWQPKLGKQLTLAGLPQATEALLDIVMPVTPRMGRQVAAHNVQNVQSHAAPRSYSPIFADVMAI